MCSAWLPLLLQGSYCRRLAVLRRPDKPRKNKDEGREAAIIDPKRDVCMLLISFGWLKFSAYF